MTAIGPGTRVKCIKRGAWDTPVTIAPTFGTICTVADVWVNIVYGVALSLREYPDDGGTGGLRRGWLASYFIPLEPDIEVLRALLTDVRDPDARRPKEIERAYA